MLKVLACKLACIFCTLLLLVLSLRPLAAADYEERLAATDRSDPDALHELVLWCQENNFHSSANRHIREILAIDPNHAPTRELQGFLWDGQRWVHESRLPPDQRRAAREARERQSQEPQLRRRQASGPGPRPEDIEWDLSIPSYPQEEARYTPFLSSVITRMGQTRDLFAMEGDWRTLTRPEHRYRAINLLAEGIIEGSYRDLWGPSQVALVLIEEGGEEALAQARSLLPFLVLQSTRSSNPDALMAMSSVAMRLNDRRVIPQLIALLQGPHQEAHPAIRQALSHFMLIREQDITVANALDWWARYHSVGDSTLYTESLLDPDPWVRLQAVHALSHDSWDERVMPTLIRLLREENPRVVGQAIRELRRVSGNTWGLNANSSSDERKRVAGQIREWWAEQRANFRPVHLRGREPATAVARTAHDRLVNDLADLDATVAGAASSQLRRNGVQAIPALLRGLDSSNGIVRNRSRDLLREISGQNFGFEGMQGNDDTRRAARQRWQHWAQEAGHLDTP